MGLEVGALVKGGSVGWSVSAFSVDILVYHFIGHLIVQIDTEVSKIMHVQDERGANKQMLWGQTEYCPLTFKVVSR